MENDPLAMLTPTDPTWNPANTVPPDSRIAAPAAPAPSPRRPAADSPGRPRISNLYPQRNRTQ